MSMTVGKLKEFLKNVPDDLSVDFCIGKDFGYSINKVYIEDKTVWLDSEEE